VANFNKVMLIGNLTRDPQLKYLPSGTPVVELGMAVNRSWTDNQSGEKREATTFVDCKAMGKPAEIINQYMTKGRPLFIEGRLDYRQWEAKDGSGKRSKLEVFIENFQFLGSREGGAGGTSRPAGRPEAAPGGDRGQATAQSGSGDYIPEDDVPF
jgi:single-strand DNA-binding protein